MKRVTEKDGKSAKLRKRAEAQLKKAKTIRPVKQVDANHLLHELQVHQIELEMQNAELFNARVELEALLAQYSDLYDFAPVGYFTLDRDGVIQKVNLHGAQMLGAQRSNLVKRRFGLFVSSRFRSAFAVFVEKVFSAGGGKETCEIELLKDNEALWARIDATVEKTGGLCRAIVSDITERKQAEEKVKDTNHLLQEKLEETRSLQERLRELSIRDPLTGLYNRRYLDETIERELARAKRENYSVSVMMLDIDHFKVINDTYGHSIGDRFLKVLSHLLNSITRQGDIACRFGGDEFFIVMPGIHLEDARHRAEQIRQDFAGLQVKHGMLQLSSNLSVGVAISPQHGLTGEEIIRIADSALYQAKQAGRNRVRVWGED
jgi:diguanylate cyclase (GGDEF)-like protein/PAS domain S-box-containing protein